MMSLQSSKISFMFFLGLGMDLFCYELEISYQTKIWEEQVSQVGWFFLILGLGRLLDIFYATWCNRNTRNYHRFSWYLRA